MARRIARDLTFFLILVLGLVAIAFPARGAGEWRDWSADLFQVAKAQNKLVILDLEAVWCHWCHVMHDTTYADPAVNALLDESFIRVRVDQDANPDLAARYQDWGWPATILFAPDGTELAKRRGYIAPEAMAAMLKAFVDDPAPGPSITAEEKVRPAAVSALTEAQRADLLARHHESWDEENGGWGTFHKFIHADSMDLALSLAEQGDSQAEARAKKTLDAALLLIDRVEGGIYQYSDEVDWRSPHYEKIMQLNASALRQYAHGFALWGDAKYRAAAEDIARWLTTTLSSPESAFFTSQDADASADVPGKAYFSADAEARKALPSPRVDTNIYARENGWAIRGLVALYAVTGDKEAIVRAVKAADWIVANRSLPGGGFAHGEKDRGGPYLGDTLAMGQAALELYAATGDRAWLKRARDAASFIETNFRHDEAGYAAYAKPVADTAVFAERARVVEDNTELARFFNLAFRYSGDRSFEAAAKHTMRYLASDQVLAQQRFLVGVLLADREIGVEPVHLTLVGPKGDPAQAMLHEAALNYPAIYKRLDVWDPREGPLENPDVAYPELDRPALFACSNRICSSPVYEAAELGPTVSRMLAASRRTAGD
jgi:uncharacterized protein YyaL (SSP411 family)